MKTKNHWKKALKKNYLCHKEFQNVLQILTTKYNLIIAALVLGVSCSPYSKDVRNTLKMAGENRKELESVLEYYDKSKGDSLKYEAACFLIENMKYHHYYQSKAIENHHVIFNLLDSIYKTDFKINDCLHVWDSIIEKYGPVRMKELDVVFDIQNITGEYLIKNIESSFEAWHRMPLKDHISFNEFCEHILPYRISKEKPDSFKTHISKKYETLLDTFNFDTSYTQFNFFGRSIKLTNRESPDSIFSFKIFMSEYFENEMWKLNAGASGNRYPVSISTLDYLKGQFGSCKNKVEFGVNFLRALGIPATKEIIPNYGNRSNPHYFIGLPDTFKIWYNDQHLFDSDEMKFFYHSYNKDEKYDNENYPAFLNHKMYGVSLNQNGFVAPYSKIITMDAVQYARTVPKVYREMYSIQKNSLFFKDKSRELIPNLFMNPYLKDVTNQYIKTSELKLDLINNVRNRTPFYLYVFNNSKWIPVAWTMVENKKANFKNVGRNIVYLPGEYRGGIQTSHSPILVKSDAEIILNADTVNLQNINLTRKYPLFTNTLVHRIFYHNTQIQGSNKKEFENYKVIKTIDYIPNSKFDINLSGNTFKYIRLVSNEGISIAEIECFSKENNKLKLNFFGEEISKNNRLTNIIDDNVLTFSTGKVFGMAPKENQLIKKITIFTRTDKNEIIEGNEYELLFWQNAWQTLGVKIPNSEILSFKNVPTNALFLLKCISEGKEERIFTYENGKQVFW